MKHRWSFAWSWTIGAVIALSLPACGGFPWPPTDPPAEPYPCAPAAAREATQAGRFVGTLAGALKNEWIVVLKSPAGAQRLRARDFEARPLGGRFVHFRGTEGAAKKLLKDADVLYISPARPMSIPKPVAPTRLSAVGSWGLDRVDQRDLPLDRKFEPYGTGAAVHVYVNDTGISPGHPDFEGRVGEGHSAVGGSWYDDHGHGTHVGGTIAAKTYGIGVKIILHACRSLMNGSGPDADVIECIQWSVQHAAENGWRAVGNMSLGGGVSQPLDDAVCEAARAGFLWAVAAGNDDADACGGSPAHVVEALTAGASSDNDARAYFSSYGRCVDLFAPGENITSLDRTNGTAVMSGTSMASPHVAAAAALYLAAHPAATAQEIHDGVVAMATPGKVKDPGADSPNLLLFVGKEGGGGGEVRYPELLLRQCSAGDPRWCLPDGTPVDHAGYVGCCLGNPEVAWDGWPLVSIEMVDWSRQVGDSTFWHRRPGPFIAADEYWDQRVRPTEARSIRDLASTKAWATVGIGGPYVEVDGKADLSRFNEAFFAYNNQVLEHVCSVGGHVEDDVDDGWRRKAGCPYSPWNKDRNLQGEDHCSFVPGDPVADAWIAKWVKHSGRYGCVTYQLSNESRGAGTAEEVRAYEQWEAERIRYWEATYGYPRHPILTNSGLADIAAASWVNGSNWHSIQYAPVVGKVTACNEINPAPQDYAREYCAAQAGKAYLWLWRSELPFEKWKADLAAVRDLRANGCPQPARCTLGTPTARQLVAQGRDATVVPQRTVAGSGLVEENVGPRAGKWISATPKGNFGRAYYCSIGWAEACAEPESFIGPVAPEGHPERPACEAQFLEAPCPRITQDRCTGTGDQCPITYDTFIVIDGVNQYHPANVRAGCRQSLDEKDGAGHIVRGEFWKATAHGKGYLRACNFDGSVCGVSTFEIDQ